MCLLSGLTAEACGDMKCLRFKLSPLSLTSYVSCVNDVESLQLSGELMLHGVLGLMRLEDR